ncbi:MAG: argonaute/piwi family protein [Cyclobacteriaceae bacterium]
MKLRYIEEPSLQFGTDHHICPKSGIYTYNPFDVSQVRPEKITIGVIGKADSVDKILEWLESCKTHIDGKQSKTPHPNLFMNFCGFNKTVGFKCEIAYDDTYLRKLNNSDFENIIKEQTSLEDIITEITSLYLNEIKFLSKNKKPDVILCALSENFMKHIMEAKPKNTGDDDEEVPEKDFDEEEVSKKEQNFRRNLKAKAMQYNVPIQIIRDRIAKPTAEMQDAATIAWNFFTALYYKASGTPWALIRKDSAETTCYAGISFFKSRDKKSTQTSIAQIFNELGKGVILRGEEIVLKKNDRTPHLDEQQAFNLLNQSLKEYYDAVKIYPKRLVLHKTSNFNQDEIYGFTQTARELHINQIDLVSIQTSDIRLYRSGNYPPMRGTHFTMTDNHHVLYTRGSVPYYETYPGRYIPRAIEIKLAAYDESPNVICDEILALTKMNWNNTQFDRQMPITIECARNVGEILKYLGEDEQMQLKYSFYM